MSYEGRVQTLCAAGHQTMYDCYQFDAAVEPCGVLVDGKPCGKPVVWTNEVDDTNFEGEGYVVLEIAAPMRIATCSECGMARQLEPTRYVVPKEQS